MKKIVIFIIVAVIIYIVAGAIVPFVFQPKVSDRTKEIVSRMNFYGEDEGTECVSILADNGEALEERIRLISQAKERIILSTFEFRTDESGKDVLAALLAAAERGVSVQILADGMPAMLRMRGNEYFYALSAMENVQIKIYNPINMLKPWKLMGRMHDKYVIADDIAYILGGRNTYDYFLGNRGGYKNYDWDVLVFQKEPGNGTSMTQLLDYFKSVWELPECRLYHDNGKELEKAEVVRAGNELRNRYETMKKESPEWFELCDYEEKTKPADHIQLVNNPIHCYAKEPTAFYVITELMGLAKEEVRFHTPYIICNDWMLERLKKVCDAVPKVVLMTNSVANNGNPFGAMDYKKNKGKIIGTGVQILEYDGGVSYHGKCFVADDRLSAVGSFNWDMRSAYIDTELMIVIDSREVNADLREKMAQYEKDTLTVADEETYFLQDKTEVQEISPKRKFRIAILRLFVGWARFLM